MSRLITNGVVLGRSPTAANNFLLDTDTTGGLRVRRGADGSLGNILTFDVNGNRTSWKSGEVIQTQTYTDTGGTASTPGSYTNVTAALKNFNPRSTNSTIIVECVFNITVGLIAAANTYGYAVLYDNGGALTFGTNPTFGVANSPGGNSLATTGVCAGALPNAALTTRQFSLRAQVSNSGQTAQCSNHFWKITEVQN